MTGHLARRIIGSAAVTVLALGVTDAQAATKKPVKHTRTVSASYTTGCGINADGVAVTVEVGLPYCSASGVLLFARHKGEKYLTISLADATGLPVHAELWLTTGVAGGAKNIAFCGSLKRYVMAQNNFQLDIDELSADATCPGAATAGTVKLAFSNLP